ncbi:MAG: redox-regulated ATPase YchF [Candidatus Neomarinimicrobiota bacterium]|jgi:hypothetical protein|nr:redox-regulated ATPase YchF [Candidatus Neomarinimicrobiota bacterium]MEC8705356.1 redox-regulated ATPase YchF [Candidatus Neomarinimicrobiota bacterium]|tara:strand:+ start:6157 stop:7254 length:1098 start_codon:yes stop_codon:yes gene_type:complete
MSLTCGIIGLPNVGKSTIFNALTSSSVPAENYPFCTIEPHIGIVPLPDERLDALRDIYNPEKVTPATVEFTDIAGLVKGASLGEGLGNQFLAQIRQVDAIVHVVRCFEDENVTHVENSVDPLRDVELIETELLLADLNTIEKGLLRLEKLSKSDKTAGIKLEFVKKLKVFCDDGMPARSYKCTSEEQKMINELYLLTAKPIMYVANINEDELMSEKNSKHSDILLSTINGNSGQAIKLCGKVEQEISVLDKAEQSEFLNEYSLSEPGLNHLIKRAFSLLNLETYFTGGEKEVRAWTIKKGSSAPKAASEIHTDFEKGFIKAEIIKYDDLVKMGSEKLVKDSGLAKLEGKEYIVQDGDCIYFHFNV